MPLAGAQTVSRRDGFPRRPSPLFPSVPVLAESGQCGDPNYFFMTYSFEGYNKVEVAKEGAGREYTSTRSGKQAHVSGTARITVGQGFVTTGSISATIGAVGFQPVDELRELVVLPVAPLVVVAQGALLRELLGDVLDDRRDSCQAKVLRRSETHVAGVDRPVSRREERPPPEEVGVSLDALDEVLEALVLDASRVPGRWVETVEGDGRWSHILFRS